MELLWVLMIFLKSELQDPVYFNDLDACLEISERVRSQNYHQRVAGDKIYVKAYCIPKKVKK